MAWLRGVVETNHQQTFIEYCINIDDIRNFTYEDSIYKDSKIGVYKAWFKNVNSYQEISKSDYEKITIYLSEVAKFPERQLPSDALLI